MEKRKLKSVTARRPKKRIGIDAIVAEVSIETGFNKGDVKLVYQTICKVVKNRMWKGESVILPLLGTMMPFIKPRGMRHALYGGKKEPELIEIPPKWKLLFVPMRSTREEFANKEVTKKQENSIYEDN